VGQLTDMGGGGGRAPLTNHPHNHRIKTYRGRASPHT
jgi:hypothetical protein